MVRLAPALWSGRVRAEETGEVTEVIAVDSFIFRRATEASPRVCCEAGRQSEEKLRDARHAKPRVQVRRESDLVGVGYLNHKCEHC